MHAWPRDWGWGIRLGKTDEKNIIITKVNFKINLTACSKVEIYMPVGM